MWRVVGSWLALIVTVSSASAAPGLVWQAPATCPDATDVRQRIERRAGAALERAIHGARVAIDARGDGYVAVIDLRGLTVENDVRELRAASCDELTDAVAIVLARVAAELPVARPPPAVEAPIADPLPGPAVAPSTWHAGAQVLGLSGIGAMPKVSVGGELTVFVRRASAYVEVAGADWRREPAVLVEGAPGAVDLALVTAALRVGWAPAAVPVRTWLGAELGSMRGSGVDLGINGMGSSRWLAVSTGVAVTWRVLPWLHVFGKIELAVPFYRPRFVLYDGAFVFRSEPVTARTGLGLEIYM